ncbi:MAG: T9SS type A sorting domain-containing protein, partial [Bacteroidia bacterium]|nr:T9SS type A sorting domain-containing protein [Bacteroidia bacterium]
NYMKIGQEFFQRDLYNFLNNNITTGVLNADVQDYFDVFPNPTTGRLNITTPFLEYQIEVMDLTGRLILSASNPTLIDLSQIKKGMYLLRLTSLGRISTKKIVME